MSDALPPWATRYTDRMSTAIAQVDAFAAGPFTGNPAAVCVLESDHPRRDDADWMQRVAEEMNLSETAFVEPIVEPTHDPTMEKSTRGEAASRWKLRWFTPAAEVELCGHATLASAHLLWESGRAPREAMISFHTRFSGELMCRRGEDDRIAMDFPADTFEQVSDPPPRLIEALGVPREALAAVARGKYDWLVEVDSPRAVLELLPDFSELKRFDSRGFAVTAWGRDERAADDLRDHGVPACDVVSRFFAPRLRIEEDPVTGSLHCLLGPWWKHRRNADTIEAYQASKRGGRLLVTTCGERVELAGHAVTIARGELLH